MANIYIGNTDNGWFDFLASLSGVDEVNFWKPSTGSFKAIGEGERFAFRLKNTRNKIGGFGTSLKVHPCQFKQRGMLLASRTAFRV